jgi:hypothetical protein
MAHSEKAKPTDIISKWLHDHVYVLGGAGAPADEGALRVTGEIANINIDQIIVDGDLQVELDATDGDSVGTYFYVNGVLGSPIPANATADGTLKVVDETSDPFAKYGTHGMDDTTTVDTLYVGQETVGGTWLLKKVEDTGVSYANISNNGAQGTLSAAWTNRVSLTYGDLSTLTGI